MTFWSLPPWPLHQPPQVCICCFWIRLPRTQPFQLQLFSIRQAHLHHQYVSSAVRQNCSLEIPGNVEFLQEIYQECSVNPGPPHQSPKGPWQTVGLDSAPECSFPLHSRHSLHRAHPCASRPWCSYLPSSRCLRYTRWMSSPLTGATALVPPCLLLQEAVGHWDQLLCPDCELLAAFSAVSVFSLKVELLSYLLTINLQFVLYPEHLYPGLLFNRDSSPTSVSSQATSSTCQVWNTALQMHWLALLHFICPKPHPQHHHQPRHHQHRFKSHHPWP